MMSYDVNGPPPQWNDPNKQLVAFLATLELLALTSSSPAVVSTAGLTVWIIRYLYEA